MVPHRRRHRQRTGMRSAGEHTGRASLLKKENGNAAYASRVSYPTVRGVKSEDRASRARKRDEGKESELDWRENKGVQMSGRPA